MTGWLGRGEFSTSELIRTAHLVVLFMYSSIPIVSCSSNVVSDRLGHALLRLLESCIYTTG